MKRTNKIYYIFLFLFFSIIFQIVIVVKLNAMENDIHKKKHQNESLKENSDHLHTNDPSSDNAGSSISNKQPDSQDVISLEELANEFQNSLVIGDSRVEGLKKFTALTDYADLCCNVGININNIMNDQFFINDEQITPLESIKKHQYKRILIAIGYNELGWTYEDTFINKYTDFINKIQ